MFNLIKYVQFYMYKESVHGSLNCYILLRDVSLRADEAIIVYTFSWK